MIDVAAKHGVTADIEVVGAEYVNTAMERLRQGRRQVLLRHRHRQHPQELRVKITSAIGAAGGFSEYDEQSSFSRQ